METPGKGLLMRAVSAMTSHSGFKESAGMETMFTLTSDKLLSMCSLSPPGSYYIKFNPKFLQSSSDSMMTTAQKSGEAHVAAYSL